MFRLSFYGADYDDCGARVTFFLMFAVVEECGA